MKHRIHLFLVILSASQNHLYGSTRCQSVAEKSENTSKTTHTRIIYYTEALAFQEKFILSSVHRDV